MDQYTAEKPPCNYCEKGIPHGGGIVDTNLVFRDFEPRIKMPFCNWPAGHRGWEIAESIRDANPKMVASLEDPMKFWRGVINHLNTVNPS